MKLQLGKKLIKRHIPEPALTVLRIELVIIRPSTNRIMPTYKKNTLKMTFQTSSSSYANIPVSWRTEFPFRVCHRSQNDDTDVDEELPPPPPKFTVVGNPIAALLPPDEPKVIGSKPAAPRTPAPANWGAAVATKQEKRIICIWFWEIGLGKLISHIIYTE